MQRLLLIILIIFSSCAEKKETPKTGPLPVKVAKAQKKDVPWFLETIGHVEPILHAKITSRIEGELLGVFFEEGQTVNEGDLLVTLDPKPFEAKLEESEALLQKELATLKLFQEKVERYSPLVELDYYSQLDFDTLVTNVETQKATVEQVEAQILDAKVNLSYCFLYAPFRGKTGILQIERGNIIKPTDEQIITIVNQISPIYVTFSLPEKELIEIRKFQKKEQTLEVLASFDDFTKSKFCGCLQMLDNQVDPKTGQVKFRATFKNEKEDLWPNQFVRTRLYLTVEKDQVVVPKNALLQTSEGYSLYVVTKNQTADFRKVEIGRSDQDFVVIRKGVKEGEEVVTEGQVNLKPNVAVAIKS